MKWIVRYHCGCTDEGPSKRSILEYCGQHGEDAAEWIKIPNVHKARSKKKPRAACGEKGEK